MNFGNQIHKYFQTNLISFLKSSFFKNQILKKNIGSLGLNDGFYSDQKSLFPNAVLQNDVNKDNLVKTQLMNTFYSGKVKSLHYNESKYANNMPCYNVSGIKISEPHIMLIGLPIMGLGIEKFLFPSIKKYKVTDPVSVTMKRNSHRMVIIRRKKMKKHKWKKRQKKMKFVIEKKKKKKEAMKEAALQEKISLTLKEGIRFNAESYLNEKISILNWERPVTKIRGRLAPKSVIEEYLEKDRLKKLLDERVRECLEKQN